MSVNQLYLIKYWVFNFKWAIHFFIFNKSNHWKIFLYFYIWTIMFILLSVCVLPLCSAPPLATTAFSLTRKQSVIITTPENNHFIAEEGIYTLRTGREAEDTLHRKVTFPFMFDRLTALWLHLHFTLRPAHLMHHNNVIRFF